MSPREIDRLPEPKEKRKMKVVVASASRTGTLGLYRALQILGYTPYHMVEVITFNGVPHMKVLIEAVRAQHNRFRGIRRYDKADFEKLLANYDCLVEVASFIGVEAIEAYAEDPDVKFILTERDPDKWVKSVNNTIGGVVKMASSLPFNVLKYFDADLYYFFLLNQVIYGAFADGTNPGDPDNALAMRRNYIAYIDMVKKTVPADRLCTIRLEDGLDWEQICPFLGVPIPKEVYPRGNEPEKFKALVTGMVSPGMRSAALKLGAVVVPTLGVLAWAGMKYGQSMFATITGRF